MKRDILINLHSNKLYDKETIASVIINNTDFPDSNIENGEIVVINTKSNEGLYTLNNDGTQIIEYLPSYKTSLEIENKIKNKVTSTNISNIVKMTKAQYNAITTKDETTLYIIIG